MPVFTLFLLFSSSGIINQYYSGTISANGVDQRSAVYLVFFITTILMPSVSFYILKRNGIVSSFSMPHRQERFFPYFTTLVYYIILYYLLSTKNFPAVFKSAALGTIAVIVIIMLINLRIKISSHAAGIAGVVAIYAVLIKQGWIMDGLPVLGGIIVLAGLIGAARLSLNAHKGIEVYLGFFVGFASEFICMNYKLIV